MSEDQHIGLLYDATRCIGCQECVKACKADHGLNPKIGTDLDASTFTVVQKHAGQYMRRMCMHCLNATCVSVCPVAALHKEKDGQVVYDAQACMGCRYCVFACPFDVPRYEWDQTFPRVSKCDFCISRTSKGGETCCSWVCPVDATESGRREDLLAKAKERIKAHPGRYINHIYGEHEAGGTSVLILSGVPFGQTGYKTDVSTEALPELTMHVLEKLPYVVVNAGILLGGFAWIIKRRMELEGRPEKRDGQPDGGAHK